LFIGLIAGLGVGLGALTASAKPLEIRISWAVAPAHLTALLPINTSMYRHYGKSYVIKPMRMRGSGPALQAIAAGEVDIGGLSGQALVLGVTRAKLDLTVIAQLMTAGFAGYPSSSFWARKGEFKSPKDLKGKRLAVNARGGTVDAALRAMLGRYGYRDGPDFQLVEVRFPAMLPALESKRVDLVYLVLPFNFIAKKKGGFEPIFAMSDALGPTQTLNWIARASWIKKNRAAVVDFLEDHMRFRAWAEDPKNRQEMLKVVSKATKRPAKNYAGWVFTKKGYYHAPDAKSDTAMLQKNIDDLAKLKILPTTLDVAKHTDQSLTKEAYGRLKR
jgi:NitT/TauT family transport system substrate-binding protein